MKITGENNPISGGLNNYKVEWSENLSYEVTLHFSTLRNTGVFVMPNGDWKTAADKSVAALEKSFSFQIFWTKEIEDEQLIVTASTLLGSQAMDIKVSCAQCVLQVDGTDILLGKEFTCKTTLSVPFNEKQHNISSVWSFDHAKLEKVGESTFDYKTNISSQKFLPKGLGLTSISAVIYNQLIGKNFAAEMFKGTLEVEVKNPYKLNVSKSLICIGEYATYTIIGLQGGEKITWKATGHAQYYSGQGTGVATFQATGQGTMNISVTIQQDNDDIILTSNSVWAGKPIVNKTEVLHIMTERNPVEIDANNEFYHYSGKISYAIESENAEYVIINETNNKFKIETSIPGNKKGEIKVRLKVSNSCGEVSNLHTIAYDTLPGLDPTKAIDLFSAKEHEFTYRRTYDMTKYVGDLQAFQMFFTFTLERRATFIHIRPFCTEEKCLGFRIYDKQDGDLETPLYTHEASDTYMNIENMPQGEYIMAVDVERDHSNKLEVIFNGYIGGNIPTNPYIIEPNENGFEFSDCRNTETYHANFYYKNEQGESVGSEAGTNNTYYILTLKKPMQLILHTAGSKVSTELHIMIGEPYDWKVLYHETGGNYDMEEIQADPEVPEKLKSMLLNSLQYGQTYVKQIFPVGEYRFVLNGIKKSNGELYNGDINFNVVGLPITGNSFDTSFELGKFIGHEFQIKSYLRDIQARKGMGIQKLYYQFNVEKNVDFMLNARSKSSFLPITFYDSNMRQIASSETEESIRINDMPGGKFYFTIDIAQMTGDELTIEGKGMFRGRDPYFSYNLGTYDKDFTISDTIDTDDGGFYETFKYTDENGKLIYTNEPEAHHVYYKIILQKRMQLIIHTTHSELPLTELHIMKGDPFGWNVLYYKDYGNEGIENDPDIPDEIKQNISFGQICVKIKLPAGEYKLVLNGTKRTNGGFRNGVLVTNVIGKVI